MLYQDIILLRTQLAAGAEFRGPFPLTQPGCAIFLDNLSDTLVTVMIRGGSAKGSLSATYGAPDVTLVPRGKKIVLVNDIPRWLGFYLNKAIIGDPVKVTLVGFNPPADYDTIRERLIT